MGSLGTPGYGSRASLYLRAASLAHVGQALHTLRASDDLPGDPWWLVMFLASAALAMVASFWQRFRPVGFAVLVMTNFLRSGGFLVVLLIGFEPWYVKLGAAILNLGLALAHLTIAGWVDPGEVVRHVREANGQSG